MTYTGTLVGTDASTENNAANVTVQWADVGSFAAGDLALIFWVHSTASSFGTESTKPSGFTGVTSVTDGGTVFTLWSKILTGAESGSVTMSGTGAAARSNACIIVVRGYSGIHTTTTAADTGTDGNHAAPSATPSIADVGVIIANGEKVTSGSSSMTAPGGYTNAVVGSVVGSGGAFVGVAYEGSAGSITGTHTASVAISPGTMVNNVSSADDGAITVLLTPAVVNGSVTAVVATATGASGVPVPSGGATVTGVAATASAAALAPTVSAVRSPTVLAVAATATGAALAPTVTATRNPTTLAVAATATGVALAPAVSGGATVTAALATSSGVVLAPAATGGATVAGVLATSTAAALVPTVSAVRSPTATAVAATGTGTALVPTATATRNPTVSPPAATATCVALPPGVSAGGSVTVTPPAATATGAALAPTVTGVRNATVAAVAATATAVALGPLVRVDAVVLAVAATAQATALLPTVLAATPTTTPLERTYAIRAEPRTLVVASEDRTYRITEPRIVYVEAEDRTYRVPVDTRTLEAVL